MQLFDTSVVDDHNSRRRFSVLDRVSFVYEKKDLRGLLLAIGRNPGYFRKKDSLCVPSRCTKTGKKLKSTNDSNNSVSLETVMICKSL